MQLSRDLLKQQDLIFYQILKLKATRPDGRSPHGVKHIPSLETNRTFHRVQVHLTFSSISADKTRRHNLLFQLNFYLTQTAYPLGKDCTGRSRFLIASLVILFTVEGTGK